MTDRSQSNQVKLIVNLNTQNWDIVPSVYANHINIHSDVTPEMVTITFMQVIPPGGDPVELEAADDPVVLSSPVVARIVLSRSKFKSFIDRVQGDYEVWFGEQGGDPLVTE